MVNHQPQKHWNRDQKHKDSNRAIAKQLQTSSIGFSADTEEHPKGHCKAIISTIECDMGGEEKEVEESTMLEEEMKAQPKF